MTPPPPPPLGQGWALTLREYFGLEPFAEDQTLQVVEGLEPELRKGREAAAPEEAAQGPPQLRSPPIPPAPCSKGYGEGEDEERGSQQPALDGQPLGGGQLLAVHLHPGEEQQGEERGERQGRACAHGWGQSKNHTMWRWATAGPSPATCSHGPAHAAV